MAINVGILGRARKVKRIYVGVNGKARRVTKVVAKHPSLGSSRLARTCYKDKERALIRGSFFFGSVSPVVCRAIWSDDYNSYLVSGTFKDDGQLSQVSLSVSGSVADTGRAVSLGGTSPVYRHPAPVAGGSIMWFSGAKEKVLSVKKIDVDSMTDDSSFSFSSGYFIASNRQHGITEFADLPPLLFTAINEYGNEFVATYSVSGGAGQSFVFSYKTNARSVTPITVDDVAKRMIVIGGSGGGIKILDLVGWFRNYPDGSKDLVDIRTASEYVLAEAADFSSDGVYIGDASRATVVNSSGATIANSYVGTVCYYNTDKSTRVCKLVVDFGGWADTGDGGEVPVHEVQQYTEEFDLTDSDLSRADNYVWRYLGYDRYRFLYVLSTVNDTVKIIKFSTGEGGIQKVGEYDTGISLSDNIVLQDTVPNYFGYAGNYGRNDGEAVPAFVITRNNEYNELVIVPPELIV